MPETFSPRLLNDPFDDPVLYVGFRHQKRAFLFDCGNIGVLAPRDLLKVTHVFVSHTHMDHFIGFDTLLRVSLNRESELHVFGPGGITENARGKLGGYTWNLIQEYPLQIAVHEITENQRTVTWFRARKAFKAETESPEPFDEVLLDEPAIAVRAAVLDHKIPCLGFRLEEKSRLNVRQERLQAMGLERSPWLDQLKKLLREETNESTLFEMPSSAGDGISLPLREWRDRLILETPGHAIAYVVDSAFTENNIERIVKLASGADQFFCEATFAKEDEARAKETRHLTSDQAGRLARMAEVKRLVPFHFSPRYESEPDRLRDEAMEAFAKAEVEGPDSTAAMSKQD